MRSKLAYTLLSLGMLASVAWAACPVVLNTEEAIKQRLTPPGQATIDVDASLMPVKTQKEVSVGEKVYQQNCALCHASGVSGSPKFGDKGEWGPRIAKGIDTLLKHAIQGFNAMPPKGACGTCTDDEIKAAIEYMIQHSK